MLRHDPLVGPPFAAVPVERHRRGPRSICVEIPELLIDPAAGRPDRCLRPGARGSRRTAAVRATGAARRAPVSGRRGVPAARAAGDLLRRVPRGSFKGRTSTVDRRPAAHRGEQVRLTARCRAAQHRRHGRPHAVHRGRPRTRPRYAGQREPRWPAPTPASPVRRRSRRRPAAGAASSRRRWPGRAWSTTRPSGGTGPSATGTGRWPPGPAAPDTGRSRPERQSRSSR